MIDRLVAEGARIVTLVGVAGVGKSRLAVEWVRAAEVRPEGVGASFLACDLSQARSLDDSCTAVAQVLGVVLAASATAEEAVVQIGRALSDLERAVIVLDNLEQLAPIAPAMIEPWLALAPRVQLLLTSRERMRLRTEQCVTIEPLGELPAVALFVARARRIRHDFELADADAPIIAEIVRKLEGIPLAIELCAARVGVLGPSQISSRLARRFDLLVTNARDAPARHGTLRGAIAWSWDLLAPSDREALAQCSVFRGGFSLEAAEAVLELGAASAPSVLDALQSLYEKSLLQAYEPKGGRGERRYGLLESIREFAEEKLVEQDGASAAVARHERFFLGAPGTPLSRWPRARVVREADNLSVAAERALARRPITDADADAALRALLLLEPMFLRSDQGRIEPYARDLDAAIAAASPGVDNALVAEALYTRALGDVLRGRFADCFLAFQRSLEVARAAGASRCEGLALTKLALLLAHADRPDDARAHLDAAAEVARASELPELDADVLITRGGVATWQGHAELAARDHADAVEKFREIGDARGQAMAAGQLALARLNQARLVEAEAAADHALALLREQEEQRLDGYVLGILARIHQARGRFDEAHATLNAALEIHRAVGDRWSEGVHLGYLGNLALETGRSDEARDAYRAAVALLRDAGERHYTAIYLAGLGAAETALGLHDAARADFTAARAALEGVKVLVTEVSVALLCAFDGAAAAEPSRALAAITRAEEPREGGPAASSEDVRFAIRTLRRALGDAAGAPPRPATRPRSWSGPMRAGFARAAPGPCRSSSRTPRAACWQRWCVSESPRRAPASPWTRSSRPDGRASAP